MRQEGIVPEWKKEELKVLSVRKTNKGNQDTCRAELSTREK
jgi:hypothetical protein